MNCAAQLAGGAENRQCIRRCAKTNIPNHKLTGVILQPFKQSELADVERLSLGYRADYRVKRFGMRQRMNAVRTVGQSDNAISGSRSHGYESQHRTLNI